MVPCDVIGKYILEKRKQCGYTQQQVADYLKVSCQAVSKWEKGVSYPSVVVLKELAHILGVSTDEILAGKDKEVFDLEEFDQGFEFSRYHRLRRNINHYVHREDDRLLYAHSPFATLYKPDLEGIEEPIFVFTVNNIGSKLRMVIEYGYHEVAGAELVSRLVNEILVKGAKPLLISHNVICGNIDGLTLETLVKGLSEACKANGVTFAGSDVSFQPDSCTEKEYSMSAGIIGVVDKKKIIDGHKIKKGDIIIGIQGAGCTNNASLQRLIEKHPEVKRRSADGSYFIEEVMKPFKCYYKALEEVILAEQVHGLIHIRNGLTIQRYYEIIPGGLSAQIDLRQIPDSAIYQQIMALSGLDKENMANYFNIGIGMIVIVDEEECEAVLRSIGAHEVCYKIGKIIKGPYKVSVMHE